MIAHVNGILADKSADSVVIEAGGVGFEMGVSAQTLQQCPKTGEKLKLYTYMSVREDAMELFGFATREEKRMFLRLISVSGIGPRTALGVLSALSVHDLTIALVTGDVKALSAAPGIGKKTAQRMALELKDKVDDEELTGIPSGVNVSFTPASRTAEADAIEALMQLGYPSNEAAKAVSRVAGQADTADGILRLALKSMGGGM